MKPTAGEFKWLVTNLRSYWFRHLGAIAAAVLTSVMALIDPLIMGWVIDEFIKSPSTAVPLIGAALVMVAYEARLCLSSLSLYWSADTYQRLVMDLRLRLLEHFDRLSLDYHETTSLGAKSFILIDSVDDIAMVGAEVIPLLAKSVITGVAAIMTMMVISPRLSVVLLSALPLYLFATKYFKRQIRATTEVANSALDRMSQYVHEHLASVPQIQILTQEAREIKKALSLFEQVKQYQRGRIISEIRYTMVNGTVTALTSAIILGYGAYLAKVGVISIGSLVVCYSYLARLFEPIGSIATAHAKFQKSVSSIRRLLEFFSITPSVAPPRFPKTIRVGNSLRLAGKDICFSYNGDRMAVHNLTYALEPGEHISIVGRSGVGKSTAAKLIARLYDPQSGTVTVNGDDVRQVDLAQLRRLVHYMPQHAVLFTGTVEENLCYGNPTANPADVRRVIEIARLESVIQRMPRGLQEKLGPSGCQISGGERQRIALARAILLRPQVLILDEATAFLDAALEKEVFETLKTYLPETSLVVISHRLAALTWIGRHLLFDRGTLIASGTHGQLHKESSLYREICDLATEERPLMESAPPSNGSGHAFRHSLSVR